MKNKIKFAKKIIDAAISGSLLAVTKNGEVTTCYSAQCRHCRDCIFNDAHKCCSELRKEWAEAEYVEPKIFTEEEKALLRALSKINWVAKDRNGEVYLYSNKPSKIVQGWGWDLKNGYMIKLQNFSDLKFESIKWEDEEPTSREEILK